MLPKVQDVCRWGRIAQFYPKHTLNNDLNCPDLVNRKALLWSRAAREQAEPRAAREQAAVTSIQMGFALGRVLPGVPKASA